MDQAVATLAGMRQDAGGWRDRDQHGDTGDDNANSCDLPHCDS
jgi:hypothetical protein